MDGSSVSHQDDPLRVIEDRVLVDRGYTKIMIRTYADRLGNSREWGMVHINASGRSGLVAAVTPEKELVLEKVWRIPLQKWVIELPGGLADKGGEATCDVALRELLEETGYIADDLVHVATFADAPGMTDQESELHIARNARKVREPELEPSEVIEVLLLPLQGITKALAGLDCPIDPKVYAAIGLLREAGYGEAGVQL